MPLSRRGFLALAGLAFDPERLLWVPGKKLISIPKPIDSAPLCYGDFFVVQEQIATFDRIPLYDEIVYVVVGGYMQPITNTATVRAYGGKSPHTFTYKDLPAAVVRKYRDEFYARVGLSAKIVDPIGLPISPQ